MEKVEVNAELQRSIEVSGHDLQNLCYTFLEELLYIFAYAQFAYCMHYAHEPVHHTVHAKRLQGGRICV